MLLAAAALATVLTHPVSPAAAPSLAWQHGAHLKGVFDVTGPRRDGRLVIAAAGGLYLLSPTGHLGRFATSYTPRPGPEAYVANSPGVWENAPRCGFPRDAIAALDLASGRHGALLISPTGHVSKLGNVPGVSGLYGITFDGTGRFGHRLLVVGRVPGGRTRISAVDCLGHVESIGIVNVPLEGGIAVAPATFGAFAGDLIAPNELNGSLYAVSPAGQLRTVAASGLPSGQDVGVESLGFVPPAGPGGAYVADRRTAGGAHPGTDHVLTLSGATLRSAGVQAGDLLAGTEGGATVVRVRCEMVCSVVTLVPVPTSAHGEGSLVVVSPRV